MLRPGPIAVDELVSLLGAQEKSLGETIEAPGQLAKHYSPGKPVLLDCREAVPGSYMIGFGSLQGDVNLSPTGDLAEAAARLYDCLHRAAASTCAAICVAPIPQEGMGGAINDRLRRAATP
jgi:L-threonylcarbamoyladenylate synthase